MKLFKKAIVILLLMAITLLPVAGLGEETDESAETAFEALRELMEEPKSNDIPAIKGTSLYAQVIGVEAAAKAMTNPTPVDIVCQVQIDFESNEYEIVISAINDVSVEEMAANNANVEALIGKENVEKTEEKFRLYEAVSYSGLTREQMLYYIYVISSNYSIIQNELPFGMTFLIVAKYGENDLIMINDAERAAELRDTVIDIVTTLAGE